MQDSRTLFLKAQLMVIAINVMSGQQIQRLSLLMSNDAGHVASV